MQVCMMQLSRREQRLKGSEDAICDSGAGQPHDVIHKGIDLVLPAESIPDEPLLRALRLMARCLGLVSWVIIGHMNHPCNRVDQRYWFKSKWTCLEVQLYSSELTSEAQVQLSYSCFVSYHLMYRRCQPN